MIYSLCLDIPDETSGNQYARICIYTDRVKTDAHYL